MLPSCCSSAPAKEQNTQAIQIQPLWEHLGWLQPATIFYGSFTDGLEKDPLAIGT